MAAHVVVIGAGVYGAAVAASLTRRGARVTVVDAGAPGGGTSGATFSWINSCGKQPRPYHDLNVAGMEAHRRLAADVPGGDWYHETGNLEWAAKAIGLPALPVVPQLMLPGGILPLPTKYRIYFGEPLKFEGDPADERAVTEHVWLVRQTIQRLLVHGLERRRNVFF